MARYPGKSTKRQAQGSRRVVIGVQGCKPMRECACEHSLSSLPRNAVGLHYRGHSCPAVMCLGCVRYIPPLNHSVQRVGVPCSAGALYRVPPPDDPTPPKLEIGVAGGSSVGGAGVRGRGGAC
jgi:hypothetical protein